MLIIVKERNLLLLLLLLKEEEGNAHCGGRMKSLFEKDIFKCLLEGNAHYSGKTEKSI